MRIFAYIIISILAAGAGQLFLRAGAIESGQLISHKPWHIVRLIELIFNWKVIIGLMLWILSSLAYVAVLSQVELSFMYCLGSINYLIVPWASHWLFKEQIGPIRILGIAVIFMGVMITLYGKYIETSKF